MKGALRAFVAALGSAMPSAAQGPSPSPPPPPAVTATSPIRLSASVTIRQDFSRWEDGTGLFPGGHDVGVLRGRIRLGVEYRDPQSVVGGGLRLSTGESANPTSPFIRLGDSFRAQPFGLDQFHLSVRPFRNRDAAALAVGKMPLPFWRGDQGTLRSELVWDDDISPLGAVLLNSVHLGAEKAPAARLENALGYFVLEEGNDFRATALPGKAYLVAEQLRVEAHRVSAAAAYYAYRNLNAGLRLPGSGVPTPAFLMRPGLQATNTHVSFGGGADGFVRNRFDVVDLLAQASAPLGPRRAGEPQGFVLAEYIHNFSVPGASTGYGLSAGVKGGGGKGSGPHPFTVYITYRNVDADAVLATFADSDLGAGTAVKGIETGANYRFLRNLVLFVHYYRFDGAPGKESRARRLFIDLTWDF